MTRKEVERALKDLRRQIRKIREAKGDRMCWMELVRLCLLLPEQKLPAGYRLDLDPRTRLKNCERYWRRECGIRELAKLIAMRKGKTLKGRPV